MRPVLGTLGFLARGSRPDLSGPVSILQRRLSRAQVSDIQETNRVCTQTFTACLQDSCGSDLFGVLR